VRAVDEPGRDLPGPVPAAQGGAGDAGVGGRAFERDPLGAFELSVQLEFEFPVVEPVFPVHLVPFFSCDRLEGDYPISSMVLTGLEVRSTLVSMFERFTPHARHVVVLAQEEARRLQHNYIGTEHILLGLLGEPEGLAFRVLAGSGMSLTGTRQEVAAIVKAGSQTPTGHIPFTPRAKKILELALREALQLHHEYIGTEHILLGVIREEDGVGARILTQHADLATIRMGVIDRLPAASTEAARMRRWLRQQVTAEADVAGVSAAVAGASAGASAGVAGASAGMAGAPGLNATPAADTALSEAARLAGPQPVGSHHLLLAALADPDTAAARALVTLGVDLDQARQVLRGVDVTGTSDEQPEEAGRRQMVIRVTGQRLTIEAADSVTVEAGRAALQALGGQADQPGTIRGDQPECASLGTVWRALNDSLEAIARRAAPAPAKPPAGEPPAGEPPAGEPPAA